MGEEADRDLRIFGEKGVDDIGVRSGGTRSNEDGHVRRLYQIE